MKNPFRNLPRRWFGAIIEINRKYKRPRLTMTPAVRRALLFLRFYLLFLVLLIIYKFITLVRH
jgi:hypothetical protein